MRSLNFQSFMLLGIALSGFPGAQLERPAQAEEVAREVAAQVVSATGKVLIRKEGGKVGPLLPGSDVYAGDVINTASDSTAKLLLKDRTIIDIGPSSLFHVNSFKKNGGSDREVELGLPYGTVRAAVTRKLEGEGKFKIKTRSATMGVRGTEFVVKSSLADRKAPGGSSVTPAAPTEVVVISGKVAVQQAAAPQPQGQGGGGRARLPAADAGQPMLLTAGQRVVADASGGSKAPEKPQNLSQEQVQKVAVATKLVDNTFQQSVVVSVTNKENKNQNSQEQNHGSSQGQGQGQEKGKEDGEKGSKEGSQDGPKDSAKDAPKNSTEAAISEGIAMAVNPAAAPMGGTTGGSRPSDGFAGTFDAKGALAPPPIVIDAGGLKKVKVTVTR